MRLRFGHQRWQFWPILARFMDYYSLFWGPRVISTINKSWDAFTFQSSTLPVLADSGLFHGVLLTVLGSQSDYHEYKTLGCVYMSVINTRSFGRFWPVSWTITHRFRVPKRFPWLSNSKVHLRVSDQQSQFGSILARLLDYYPILGSRSHFHD